MNQTWHTSSLMLQPQSATQIPYSIRLLLKDPRSERPVHRDRRRFAPPSTVSGAQAARQGLLRYRTSRGSQFCTSVASHLSHLLASHLFFLFLSFFLFLFLFLFFFSPQATEVLSGDAFTP